MANHVTANNKSPLIEVMAYFWFSLCALSVAARFGTKWIQTGRLALDDHLIAGSLVAGMAQAIATLVQSHQGLGRHLSTLSADQRDGVVKAGYAADIFFVVSIGLAKLSFIETTLPLTQQGSRKVLKAFEGVVVVWSIASLFVLFFECHPPEVWNYLSGNCINREAFWTSYSVINLLLEAATVGVMLEAFSHIQTTRSKRILVMGVFGNRVLMVPALIVQIYFSINGTISSSDSTFTTWTTTIALQLTQCFSIITACVPILKPLLESLETGQMNAQDMVTKARGGYSSSDRASRGLSNGGNLTGTRASKTNDIKRTLNSATPSTRAGFRELKDVELTEYSQTKANGATTTFAVTAGEKKSKKKGSWDGNSETSQKGLIRQTVTWQVKSEAADPSEETP